MRDSKRYFSLPAKNSNCISYESESNCCIELKFIDFKLKVFIFTLTTVSFVFFLFYSIILYFFQFKRDNSNLKLVQAALLPHGLTERNVVTVGQCWGLIDSMTYVIGILCRWVVLGFVSVRKLFEKNTFVFWFNSILFRITCCCDDDEHYEEQWRSCVQFFQEP